MDEDAPLLRLLTEIGIIDQLANARAEALLPDVITMAQYRVLNHFVRLGGAWSPARLARAFQLTRQTMTSTLARMEAAGLVSMLPDPKDRRGKLVSLTDRGAAMHRQCGAALRPVLEQTAAKLPDGLVDQLLPGLTRLREILDANRA